MYLTISQPGSCNNLCEQSPDLEEFKLRNAANLK
jgi:hypothetical protein